MNQTTTPAALDLDKLEALARAATPGPWRSIEHSWAHTGIYAREEQITLLDISNDATEDNQDELEARMAANAGFMAAANPATILALIDLARRSSSAAGSEQDERALTLTQFEPIASSWDKCHYDGIDIGESLRHDFKRLAQQAAPEKAEHKDLQRYLDWYKSAATREEARNAKACIESLLREAAPEAPAATAIERFRAECAEATRALKAYEAPASAQPVAYLIRDKRETARYLAGAADWKPCSIEDYELRKEHTDIFEFQALGIIGPTAASGAQPVAAAPAEPPRMTTDESREYLIKFTEQHFTDKTFHRYIRNDQGNRQGLAGDFAWQLARVLRILTAAPAAPVAQATTASASVMCSTCCGNGKLYDLDREATEACSACDGTGRTPAQQTERMQPSRETAPFPDEWKTRMVKYGETEDVALRAEIADLRAALAQQGACKEGK